jgi:nucleoside-diphosphate kinase
MVSSIRKGGPLRARRNSRRSAANQEKESQPNMAVERTFCIVKPDAVEKRVAGAILHRIEEEGFRIVALKLTHLSRPVAEGFYDIHRQRPFFGELVQFMTRSPVILAVLEREDAVAAWRDRMGATDPAKAAPGTIRKQFGTNVGENATHGSDSLENAKREIAYFFAGSEVATSA